jgi:type IV pilus assembly protein PilC
MSNSIDIRKLYNDPRPAPQRPAGPASPSRPGRPAKDPGDSERTFWNILNKDIKLFGSGLPDKIKESFYLELSVLLAAGVDIRGALDIIQAEQPKKKYRLYFSDLCKRIVGGATLSAAMQSGGLFTPYEFFSIRIGEETGKLVMVLAELAVYYKKRIDQRRQIIGALTYPVLVLTIAGFAVGFMLTYVVPMFADVLKRFGGDLPYITRLVMRLSALFKQSIGIFLLLLSGIIAIAISQRKKTWFRQYSSIILIRIPMIGDLISKTYLSRFSTTMALLIGSRIPMLQALELVKKMIGFFPIEDSLTTVAAEVMSGSSLHSSLSSHKIYPKKMISLIKVGEEVNQLDLFFSKVSAQYSSEVEHRTNVLSKFLEPLIIVGLGLVVGVILIAMYLPLFKLGQSI